MNRRRVQLILLIVPAMWGLVFVAVERVLRQMSAFQLVTVRFAIIFGVVGGMMLARPGLRSALVRSRWRLLLFAGFLGVPVSNLAIVHAQNYLSPTLASLIITTAPVLTVMLAPSVLGERVTQARKAGFLVAFAGAAIVIVVGAGESASFTVSNVLGASVAIITPLAWALYTLLLKKLTVDHSAMAGVGATLMVGSLFMIPFVPTAVDGGAAASTETWLWLAYLAFGGTFIPYLLWFWSMRYLDASETSAYLYLVPLFALVWSLIVLGDLPPAGALAGGALVLIGVALAQRGGKPVRVRIPKEAA